LRIYKDYGSFSK